MSTSLVAQLQEFVKRHLFKRYGDEEGQAIFNELKNKPLSWWLNGETAQPAEMSTYMFEEVQGYANFVRAAPWRIGCAQGPSRFYTSDNPVSRYLPPVRPWWDTGAFPSFHYYLPLSPESCSRSSGGLDQRRHRRSVTYGDNANIGTSRRRTCRWLGMSFRVRQRGFYTAKGSLYRGELRRHGWPELSASFKRAPLNSE